MLSFERWNKIKQDLHTKKERVFVHIGDMVYINIGYNIGYEQNGKNDTFGRPVIVIQTFGDTFIGLPLSTKEKTGKYYHPILCNNKNGVVILSQIRIFDTKRVQRKMGRVDVNTLEKIRKAVRRILFL